MEEPNQQVWEFSSARSKFFLTKRLLKTLESNQELRARNSLSKVSVMSDIGLQNSLLKKEHNLSVLLNLMEVSITKMALTLKNFKLINSKIKELLISLDARLLKKKMQFINKRNFSL